MEAKTPIASDQEQDSIDLALGRKARRRWAVAMFVITGEAAYIGNCYLPAEHDDWSGKWWLLVVAAVAFSLTMLGWKHEKRVQRLAPWIWHTAWWVGILATAFATLATANIRSGGFYFYRLNNRQLNAAIDQFMVENPERIFIRYDDLVGPTRYIKAMNCNVGEDYSTTFPIAINTPAYLVPCADGRTVVLFPDVALVVLGSNGKLLPRYGAASSLKEWNDLMQTPDGVRTETISDGRRLETTFHGGWPDGPFKAYAPDGKLVAEATYAKGRLVGPCWHYLNDGARFDEGHAVPQELAEQEFQGRGDARRGMGDPNGALSDYELARQAEAAAFNRAIIDAKADIRAGSAAIVQAGEAKIHTGDFAGVEADLSAVMPYAPSAPVIELRGDARAALGEIDGAMDDYTHAIRENKETYENRVLQYKRAHLLRLKHDLAGAAQEFRPLANLGYFSHHPDSFDGAFWLYLVQTEAGSQPAATTELAAFLHRNAKAPSREVEQAIGRFLLRQTSEEQLQSATATGPHDITKGFLVPFMAAMVHRQDGDRDGALLRFRQALAAPSAEDDFRPYYIEARSAVRALEAQGH